MTMIIGGRRHGKSEASRIAIAAAIKLGMTIHAPTATSPKPVVWTDEMTEEFLRDQAREREHMTLKEWQSLYLCEWKPDDAG